MDAVDTYTSVVAVLSVAWLAAAGLAKKRLVLKPKRRPARRRRLR